MLAAYQALFQESAYRFADHYLSYAQAHETDFPALDEDLANLLHALTSYSRLQAWPDIACLVKALDIFLDTRGHWSVLRFWLEQVVNHAEATDDPTVRLDILLSLASVTSSQGDRDKAEEHYQEAILLAKQVDDKDRLGSAYYGLYTVYTNQGRSDKAQECLERFLALAQQSGDRLRESLAHYLKATDLADGRMKAPSQLPNLATQIAREIGHPGKAFTSSLRAWSCLKLNRLSRARRHYLDALAQFEQERDAQGTAFVLYQLGLIAALEDDPVSALEYYRQSESIARQMDDRTGLVLLYSSIGLVYLRQQRFDLALPYLEQGVMLARDCGDQAQVAENLYWLGYAAANTGDVRRAERLFGESLGIFTQLHSPDAQKVREALTQLHKAINLDLHDLRLRGEQDQGA